MTSGKKVKGLVREQMCITQAQTQIQTTEGVARGKRGPGWRWAKQGGWGYRDICNSVHNKTKIYNMPSVLVSASFYPLLAKLFFFLRIVRCLPTISGDTDLLDLMQRWFFHELSGERGDLLSQKHQQTSPTFYCPCLDRELAWTKIGPNRWLPINDPGNTHVSIRTWQVHHRVPLD